MEAETPPEHNFNLWNVDNFGLFLTQCLHLKKKKQGLQLEIDFITGLFVVHIFISRFIVWSIKYHQKKI